MWPKQLIHIGKLRFNVALKQTSKPKQETQLFLVSLFLEGDAKLGVLSTAEVLVLQLLRFLQGTRCSFLVIFFAA